MDNNRNYDYLQVRNENEELVGLMRGSFSRELIKRGYINYRIHVSGNPAELYGDIKYQIITLNIAWWASIYKNKYEYYPVIVVPNWMSVEFLKEKLGKFFR